MYALIDQQSIIVSEGQAVVLVAASDPSFGAVRRYLVDERGEDFQTVRDIVERFHDGVKATLNEALSIVDGFDDAEPYRVVHGIPVEEVVLSTAVRLADTDDGLAPLGAFLQRLERNPSQASRSQLFGWLKAGGFTLTTDGLIVGYKSVRSDGLSAHTGSEPVTVEYQNGDNETVTGRVPYPVGATVSMDRDLVDDDRASACSVGLHVGTYRYAETFSDQMVVVLVDPADVVSVPSDHNDQKMRVCRLHVAALNDGNQISDAVIENIYTVPDDDAIEAYVNRPENASHNDPGFDFGDEDEDDDDDAWT